MYLADTPSMRNFTVLGLISQSLSSKFLLVIQSGHSLSCPWSSRIIAHWGIGGGGLFQELMILGISYTLTCSLPMSFAVVEISLSLAFDVGLSLHN